MARWTDFAVWRGPSPNTGDGDSRLDEPADRMYEYRGVVVHIAVGYYEGTIAWQHNPDANVSSHFVTGRKPGQLAQVVDTAIRAWTQSAGNGYWLSVENEGFLKGHKLYQPGWESLTAWQIEANAQILARAHREYGVPLQLAVSPTGRGLGYHSMGAEHGYNWGHSSCPGQAIKAQLPLIVVRAKEIVTQGGNMTTPTTDVRVGSLFQAVFDGGGSCGTHVAPKNGRPSGNSMIQKLDWLIEKIGVLADAPADVDEAALAAEILKALSPQAIADAISDDLAQGVVDLLAARLAAR